MEGLLRNHPPAGPNKNRVQRRQRSDTVGCHLKDNNISECLETHNLSSATYVQANAPKKKIKINRKNKFSFFATLNINSLLKTGKLKVLTDNLDQQNISIIALQELRNTDQDPFESGGYRIYKGPPGKRVMKNCPQFGMGFAVRVNIIDSIEDFKSTTSRTATLTFKSMEKTYTIINVHAPTNNKNHTEKEQTEIFWEELDQLMNNIPAHHIKILMGDFNAQIGHERKYRDVVGKYPAHNKTNKNGMRLIELCRDHGLVLKTTRYARKPHKLKTWKHPNPECGEFQLDHVAMSREYHREIYNVKVLRGIDIDSDHYISKIKIKLTPKGKPKPKNKCNKRKYDPTRIINNRKFQEQTKTQLNNKLEEIVQKLKDTAQELAPVRRRKKHQWWDDECDNIIKRRHQAWLNNQSQRTKQSQEELSKARHKASKEIRRIKRNHHKQVVAQIEETFKQHNTRNYYRTFKQHLSKYTSPTLMLKDVNGNLAHNNQDNAEVLAGYFKNLLNCEEPKECLQFNRNPVNKTPIENICPPTYKEVESVIDSLKNYKASGEDQLTAELWKYTNKSTKQNLHKRLIDIWNTERMPEHWNTAIIHPLHKKGDKTDPNNYRGISLLDVTYKIFSKVLLTRIQGQLDQELGEYQGGFRPGRSCPDQIICLKWIIKHRKTRSKNLVITFVDFKKAYDCIHRDSLLRILEEFGLHKKLINLIKVTLTNTRSVVKFRGEVSEKFEVKTGLRQGDGLSPLLFNCVLEKIMREWNKRCPPTIKIGKEITVNCLAFADDLALLSSTLEEAIHQIEVLQEIAAKVGLQISFEKTEIMPTFKQELQALQLNNGNKIKIVKKFKYLGEIITWNLNEKLSIETRVTKLKQAQRITWPTYKKKSLSINAKIRHYNSVIKPEATYASETIFKLNTQSTTDKLQKIDRRILRTAINFKHQVHGKWWIIPNNTIYKENESIIDTMRKRRIAFFGHLYRLSDTRLTKQLLKYQLKNKTQNKWIQELKSDMKDLKITERMIEDREEKKILKENKLTQLPFNKRNQSNVVITEKMRAARSRNMKLMWERKKQQQGVVMADSSKTKTKNIDSSAPIGAKTK